MEHSVDTQQIEIPEEILNKWQTLVDVIADLARVPVALIIRLKPPYMEVIRANESDENPYKVGAKGHLDKLYCKDVVEKKERLLIPNALKDKKWNTAPEVKLGLISHLGFPLLWPNGDVFGTLGILDSKEREYGERYDKMMMQFRELIEAHLTLLY